jgi:hypothetical protein
LSYDMGPYQPYHRYKRWLPERRLRRSFTGGIAVTPLHLLCTCRQPWMRPLPPTQAGKPPAPPAEPRKQPPLPLGQTALYGCYAGGIVAAAIATVLG